MPTRLRLMVVDDHLLFRTALTHLLEEIPFLQVIAEAEDGESAVEIAGRMRPDVVLMDINLPGISGIEATRRIVSACPATRVIGLSMYPEEACGGPMLQAGAVGFLSKKSSSLDVLESAIMKATGVRPAAGTAGHSQPKASPYSRLAQDDPLPA